jgi:hypothetical protein
MTLVFYMAHTQIPVARYNMMMKRKTTDAECSATSTTRESRILHNLPSIASLTILTGNSTTSLYNSMSVL